MEAKEDITYKSGGTTKVMHYEDMEYSSFEELKNKLIDILSSIKTDDKAERYNAGMYILEYKKNT